MKKKLLLLFLLLSIFALGQTSTNPAPTANAFTFITSGTGAQTSKWIDVHAGYTTFNISWAAVTTTSVTGCSVQVDYSPDGVNVSGQVISSQTCNSNGQLSAPITAFAASWIRVNFTGITAGQMGATVTYINPLVGKNSGGGGGGTASVSVNGGSALSGTANFQNGTSGNAINFSNPSSSNVQATIKNAGVTNAMLSTPSGNGTNVVTSNFSSSTSGGGAFLDANGNIYEDTPVVDAMAPAFSTGNSMCKAISLAWASLSNTSGTVDARGFTGTQSCNASDTNSMIPSAAKGRLLLGNVRLYLTLHSSGAANCVNAASSCSGSPNGTQYPEEAAVIIPTSVHIEGMVTNVAGVSTGLSTILACAYSGQQTNCGAPDQHYFPITSTSVVYSSTNLTASSRAYLAVVLGTSPGNCNGGTCPDLVALEPVRISGNQTAPANNGSWTICQLHNYASGRNDSACPDDPLHTANTIYIPINSGVTSMALGGTLTGYTSAPSCAIGAPSTGGIQATCQVTYSAGSVTGIYVINRGQNYQSVPSCTLTGGGGSATCTAAIETACASGHNCGYLFAETPMFETGPFTAGSGGGPGNGFDQQLSGIQGFCQWVPGCVFLRSLTANELGRFYNLGIANDIERGIDIHGYLAQNAASVDNTMVLAGTIPSAGGTISGWTYSTPTLTVTEANSYQPGDTVYLSGLAGVTPASGSVVVATASGTGFTATAPLAGWSASGGSGGASTSPCPSGMEGLYFGTVGPHGINDITINFINCTTYTTPAATNVGLRYDGDNGTPYIRGGHAEGTIYGQLWGDSGSTRNIISNGWQGDPQATLGISVLALDGAYLNEENVAIKIRPEYYFGANGAPTTSDYAALNTYRLTQSPKPSFYTISDDNPVMPNGDGQHITDVTTEIYAVDLTLNNCTNVLTTSAIGSYLGCGEQVTGLNMLSGFQINGAAPSGHFPCGNGTQYADCTPGVPVDATNPSTLLSTDRGNFLNWTSGTALALPAAGTGNFANNFPFSLANTEGATLTITPNAGASDKCNGATTCTVLNNWDAFLYNNGASSPSSWSALRFPDVNAFPSCADSAGNHLNFTAAGGITCGTTSSGGGSNPTVTTETANFTAAFGSSPTVYAVTAAASGGVRAAVPNTIPSSGQWIGITNASAYDVTVYPGTTSANGAAIGTVLLGGHAVVIVPPGQGINIYSDGTNYDVQSSSFNAPQPAGRTFAFAKVGSGTGNYPNGTGFFFNNIGAGSTSNTNGTLGGSGTVPYWNWATGAGSNNSEGINQSSTASWLTGKNITIEAGVKLAQTTTTRFWFRLGDGAAGLTNDAAVEDMFGFRYSTGASDTNWAACVGNGSATACTSTGVAIGTTFTRLHAQCFDNLPTIGCEFLVNGVLTNFITTDAPTTANRGMEMIYGINNVSTTNSVTTSANYFYVESDN